MAISLALAVIPLAASAQARVDIVQIWESFIASGVAAKACDADAAKPSQNFLANLTTVTIRATQAIQERNPTFAPPELTRKIEAVSSSIQNKVDTEITANGCASARIQQLLAMYRMHSAMKF